MLKEHRLDCMFHSMLAMRQSQNELMEENVRLKKKVHYLEDQLEDMARRTY